MDGTNGKTCQYTATSLMPIQDIALTPGVNTQVTQAQNQAGVSQSNLIRYKQGLVQKYGGWELFYPYSISTAPIRDIHAYQALRNEEKWVAVAALNRLVAISVSAGTLYDITPQYLTTNVSPSFSVSTGGQIVTIYDPDSSGVVSQFSGVNILTPIALGTTFLSGGYPITTVLSSVEYQITSSSPSSIGESSAGTLPKFYTTAGSGLVGVILPNNNYEAITGLYYPFNPPTVVGGLTISGPYNVYSILDSTSFLISSPVVSSATVNSSTPVTMNSTLASFYYYVTQGPQTSGGLYGAGTYGTGLYGTGISAVSGTGLPYVATGWTLDNWGEILVACAQNGPIYIWAADLGYFNAQVIIGNGAPLINLGAFVALPAQIMMAWGSTQSTGQQDVLTINWSDSGAQAGFSQWIANPDNFAGSFKIPVGSSLVAACQTALYCVFLTDVDCWIAQYVGQPIIWSFSRIGTACGCLGPHALVVQSGIVYWAGISNFFMLGPNGVQVLPCTVWDFFFQQLDVSNQQKIECGSNSAFNELTWYFPVIGGTGENTAYVKVHIEGSEYEWDYGYLNRTAWQDVSAVGFPLGADSNGYLYQHEMTNDASGTPMPSSVQTGYFEIGDGTQLSFVDWVLPDMKWGMVGFTTSAIVQFTFYVTDYAGQPERVYGPFAVTQSVPYISCRMRGRFWRVQIQSQDLGSFWRVGRIKFRWAPAGRR